MRYPILIVYADGFQACYEVMRGEHCAYANDYGEDANTEECDYIYRQRKTCAAKWQDCPLHKEKK